MSAVEEDFCWAGAKAAAEATRDARIASFMVKVLQTVVVVVVGNGIVRLMVTMPTCAFFDLRSCDPSSRITMKTERDLEDFLQQGLNSGIRIDCL